jgi:hypothetical protein
MTVLLAVCIAVVVLGVLSAVFSVLSRREAGRGLAGLSAEDLFARVESVPGTHGDNCPWKTAAFPRYVAEDAR